jgi:hypothetical protein
LLTGAVAPAASWYACTRIATLVVGSDARGFAITAPPPNYERHVLVNDAGLSDEQLTSTWLHEAAHCFLFPPPRVDLTALEDSVYSTDEGFWGMAAQCGLVEKTLQQQIRDEYDACALAAAWGATGESVDGDACTLHLRQRLFEFRTDRERQTGAVAV